MTEASLPGRGKGLIGAGKQSPLFWGLAAVFLAVMVLALFFCFSGREQKPGRLPPEVLSKIHQEKRKAQEDFADFIQTPAGKLWQRYPYWTPAICQKIVEGQLSPGMSKEQAGEAISRVVEIRRAKDKKFSEEWVVEGKGKEKMILKFEENALISVERK
jgi:hypothetical protein